MIEDIYSPFLTLCSLPNTIRWCLDYFYNIV